MNTVVYIFIIKVKEDFRHPNHIFKLYKKMLNNQGLSLDQMKGLYLPRSNPRIEPRLHYT
jgi:hypothetical protein